MSILRLTQCIPGLTLRRLAAVCAVMLVMLTAATGAQAAQITLRWNASPEQDVAGYTVHFGTRSGQYDQSIDVGKAQRATISDLEPGTTYYFTATAYDSYGFASNPSEEIVFTAGQTADGTGGNASRLLILF
ncbi:fibronectin type III domain-containing protein [Desulfocurvibacter africanus PCS]|uniref:Fibronectin type III domain-containing protein n=1 Tax=Desulfocurvibacter africanus PCS TaxID=1262666 RepID=M5PVW3_DESAF|nr:fibronectin type III domain-containing protein [Desulfocurvibacter africanus]EMG38135.1 fibronectin type III domain-containing protein [Desulfocurvibacter africanus PCS]